MFAYNFRTTGLSLAHALTVIHNYLIVYVSGIQIFGGHKSDDKMASFFGVCLCNAVATLICAAFSLLLSDCPAN